MILSLYKKVISIIRQTLFIVFIILISSLAGIYFFNKYKNNKIQTVQHIILQAQTKEGFLVIGRKIVNISVTKRQNSQGWLKSILFKHIISINAPVEVWYGFDLKNQKIKLSYNLKNNCININLPNKVQILTTHVILPIKYKTEQGIIYGALDKDEQKDLNQALYLLQKNAKQSATKWLQTPEAKQYIKEAIQEFKTQINGMTQGNVKICLD